eukprot:4615430-Amphidinium_carterae.1
MVEMSDQSGMPQSKHGTTVYNKRYAHIQPRGRCKCYIFYMFFQLARIVIPVVGFQHHFIDLIIENNLYDLINNSFVQHHIEYNFYNLEESSH